MTDPSERPPLVEAWGVWRGGDHYREMESGYYDREHAERHADQGGTVVPLIAADRLSELVPVVKEFLRYEGGEPGCSMHSWRCEHPDRYGPCTCLEDVSTQLLAALRAHLERS